MAESVVSVSARVALAWSLVYVSWRGLFTLSGADAPALFVLFGAEVLAVVVFAARVRAARTTPLEVITSPDAPDRKSTRLNSSHTDISRMPSSA